MKKVGVIVMVALLVGAIIGMAQSVPHPNTMVVETIGTISTLDPAWCYDDASG